jgi:membrane-bound lytic murein transglycosylase MltF
MNKEESVKSLLVLVTIFFSVVCVAKDDAIPLLSITGANWSSDEVTFIRALHQKGSLKAATRDSSPVYQRHKDGSTTGFHYNVLKGFTDLTKIALELEIVSWDSYFYKQNEDIRKVQNDPSYSFIPTLIGNVDLYLDTITTLPWREKMFDIIKYVPARQMIISRKNNIPDRIQDLDNKSFALIKHTSMEENIKQLEKNNNINIIYQFANSFDALDKMVSTGQVDFTVYDSDQAFSALKNFDNLTIAWPVSDVQMMGWGINKNNPLLKSVLEKYIKFAQETGMLDKYWKRSYGVKFVEYLNILNLGATRH